jgi:hypothetical protein
MENEITDAAKRKIHQKEIEFAEKHSPDLSKLIPLKVNKTTTVYVEVEKLEKRGKQYYIDKYNTRVSS